MDPEVQEVPVTSDPTLRMENEVVEVVSDAMQPNEPLEDLEKALENACETLAALASNVMDFTYDSQEVLFSKVNEFVKDLREIDSKSKAVNASIPFEVIEAIDKGRNPEQCTYQMLESCAESNNVALGKLDIMRIFRDAMETAMTEGDVKEKGGNAGGGSGKESAGEAEALGTTPPANGF